MKKNSLVRTIYLYLFTIIGLALIIISGVRFIDMGLKTFIFKAVDEAERINYSEPPYPRILISKVANIEEEEIKGVKDDVCLSATEKQTFDNWIINYNNWENRSDAIDRVTANKQRDASNSLAMLFIGLPLYLYHWFIIKRETKDKED